MEKKDGLGRKQSKKQLNNPFPDPLHAKFWVDEQDQPMAWWNT